MLFDTTETETAAELKTRLIAAGDEILVSSNIGSSVAYAANGLILRCQESVKAIEYRGLTKAAAEKLITLAYDNVTTTIYYKQIGTGDDYAAVGVQTGTKVECVAAREADSNGFTVLWTETTYGAANTTGWTTTRPSSLATTGILVSKSKRSARVAAYDGDQLYAQTVQTVTEFRYLTQAEADALIQSQASDSVVYTTYKHNDVIEGQTIVAAQAAVQTGTLKCPSYRYSGDDKGFTVTVNQTTYSATGNRWYT